MNMLPKLTLLALVFGFTGFAGADTLDMDGTDAMNGSVGPASGFCYLCLGSPADRHEECQHLPRHPSGSPRRDCRIASVANQPARRAHRLAWPPLPSRLLVRPGGTRVDSGVDRIGSVTACRRRRSRVSSPRRLPGDPRSHQTSSRLDRSQSGHHMARHLLQPRGQK